ncbi:hypothetical protein PENSPDRAFT_751067 [Peniophora sp. CONT]|nr:hypothetical protein PENSPDRAFT_751067 [Peniophora sp. CONT]
MTFPSPDDTEALESLVERDAVFREKLDTATSLAETLGKEAVAEIYAAQLSLQRLSEGGYPPEMAEVIKDKARETTKRYSRFLSAMSSLKESRLNPPYGPGESMALSLPSEILSIIFILATEYPPMFDGSLDGKRWMPSTLRLVCRHWKETAEKTSRLWRDIDITNGLERTRSSVQWSRTVPLNVSITVTGSGQQHARSMECAQIALAELPRIRTLDVLTSFAYGAQEPREFAELLASRPAPSLTEFKFSRKTYISVSTLRSDTFAGEVPAQLRRLTVLVAKIHPLCPIFRAPLTSLNLQFCTIWENVNQLLHMLAGLPMLEHLVLNMNDEDPQLDVSAVHLELKSVKLLNLKTLYIRDDVKVLLAVFPRLDIPNVTAINIAIDYVEIDSFMAVDLPEINNTFGSYINEAFGNNESPPDAFTSLAITSLPDPTGYNHVYSAEFSDPAVDHDGLRQFTLGFVWARGFTDQFRTLLMRTLSWTPTSYRVVRLMATDKVDFLHNDVTWTQILEWLHGLEEVNVGSSAQCFIRSLALGPDVVSSLRKLVFSKAHLDDVIINALAALLSARHDLEYPPIALSFISCSITDAAVERLEGTLGVSEVYAYVDRTRKTQVVDADDASDSD